MTATIVNSITNACEWRVTKEWYDSTASKPRGNLIEHTCSPCKLMMQRIPTKVEDLTTVMLDRIKFLSKSNSSAAVIRDCLMTEFNLKYIGLRVIITATQRIEASRMDGMSQTAQLFQQLHSCSDQVFYSATFTPDVHGAVGNSAGVSVSVNDGDSKESTLRSIFVQTNDMRELFCRFPEFLCCDCTSKQLNSVDFFSSLSFVLATVISPLRPLLCF